MALNSAEEKERTVEEEMMQLNYERKVAVLLHQSDKVIAKLRIRALRDTNEEDVDNNDGHEEGGDVKRIRLHQTNSSSSSSSGCKSPGTAISVLESMITAATAEGEAIFESILGTSADSLIPHSIDPGSFSDTIGKSQKNSAKDDVAQFLRKRKAENKKKITEALTSDYNPLDFMDWTARSL